MENTKINYKKLAFLAIAVSAVSGIAFYFIRQGELVKQTCFNFKTALVAKLTLQKTIVQLVLELKNKSDIPFTVTALNLDVAINGIPVSKIYTVMARDIPAKSAKDFPVIVEFSPQDLVKKVKDQVKAVANLKSILAMASNPQQVVFTFKGTMSVKSSVFVFGSLSIDITETLKELKAPSTEKC